MLYLMCLFTCLLVYLLEPHVYMQQQGLLSSSRFLCFFLCDVADLHSIMSADRKFEIKRVETSRGVAFEKTTS